MLQRDLVGALTDYFIFKEYFAGRACIIHTETIESQSQETEQYTISSIARLAENVMNALLTREGQNVMSIIDTGLEAMLPRFINEAILNMLKVPEFGNHLLRY